jgi:hypothetical protein
MSTLSSIGDTSDSFFSFDCVLMQLNVT